MSDEKLRRYATELNETIGEARNRLQNAVPLAIDYDRDNDIVIIEGVKYSGALFRAFAFAEVGSILRIEQRKDGLVTVSRLRL
jgi:hypothetical protein